MIRIIAVGKIKENYLNEMIADYLKRINKYHKLEIIEIIDNNPLLEGKNIISKIKDKAYNIVLSIEGEQYNSLDFASFIDNTLMNKANINFIIGGSEGLSEDVLKIADKQISFSNMTFPHGLFRAILLEQIYRSFKIKNNERYHK
ncbi:MAG: 23S rRNA (pseudouridine(1915)-N(3))-methyltransferase RlmH [Bacilli bacterium]|nr:23S rRNA (pseudouridine(1915)-N(3))-methyltransferase RlmH [Bacilli bacterium]MDD3895802.1 23S rRNA (pseudouridine(1915)-N(3))-methyltransferase RlmH [Bacilli bacterium]MDD4407744.1 23S rRNA (pseudouridine(1915)-N(3))-methyltransferase RlmH [Bacilli bacterium]